MSRSTLIALSAGIASALLWRSGLLGPITALPLFLAGLGLGTRAGTIACLTGFFLAWVLSVLSGNGAWMAGPYGLIYAIPALVVIRQALLHRPGRADPGAWYSTGGIVSTLTAFNMGLLLLAAAVFWIQGLSVLEAVSGQVTMLVNAVAPDFTPEERSRLIELMASIVPGVMAATWMLLTLVNGGLAQSLLTRAGRNVRPKDTLREINLPLWMSWLIVGSAAIALAGPGDLGYIGRNLALVAAVPFFLVGVSLAHLFTRRWTWRRPALAVFYLALLFGPVSLLVAGIGIIDQWFGLRHRLGAPGNDQETE